jgi:hypothetical protein
MSQSRLQESLRSFLTVEGVRTATVIDIATGMIVRSVGKPDRDLPATAAYVADEARAVRGALGAGGAAGELVEMTTTTGTRLHVATILRGGPGEGLLLFVDVDRAKSNMALASRRISQLAPAVLA